MKLTERQCELLLTLIEANNTGFDDTLAELAELHKIIASEHDLADGERIKHVFTGRVELPEMRVVVEEELLRRMPGNEALMATHFQHVLDVRQEMVRAGLVSAGWTPPPGGGQAVLN